MDEGPTEPEITEQALRLYRFGEAWVDNVWPVPCVICGVTFGRSDIPRHLLEHR